MSDATGASPSLLSEGQTLGNRYRVVRLLGRGGMGELWQAVDRKLRVEVALKSVHAHLFSGEQELEMLRREVLAARQVVSPNVCRIFDLVEVDGQELVSMEYVDGTTLLDLLRETGGVEIQQASEIASQFLAGLEAIHEAGLVHRDVKPENLMVTRAGRVLVMDFGIAKEAADQSTGSVSGTPAYMAPEQARGDPVDARSDVYAAGVVLAELASGEAVGESTSRQTLWRKLHRDPPEVPEGPWARVIRKAVAKDPAERYESAGALARALEEATLRTVGADDLTPYPGLSPFTEDDAEYFFGREAEVEAVWKKLRRPHLEALIGPSGAGKSSFVRAGLLPAMPEGWRGIVCHPGDRPLVALARALTPELSGDIEALQELVRFEEPDVAVALFAGWRSKHEQVLLIVDQFEELFTLNPPETQTAVAELLGRLVLEADVHVLLSMRDDFLQRCGQQPALAPVFSDMTLLNPPTGAALRRAMVQPALKCGYRFEDEDLVDEMLAEVADERGALPLLAFTVASLWERRDTDSGLLTRAAYEAIGGVAGALARHAEATLEKIGGDRQQMVREVFRNLVTAQGTRASRDREEILSVFTEREAADKALHELIDARLLTAYELPGDEGAEGRHRVEIVHESLLSNWPRLVRWRTQDADRAQLRDQLRQAAQLWEERDRPDDLLWTGTSLREYQLWRERYPGGLTTAEDAFAGAMEEQAGRKRRLRRTALSSVGLLLLAVLVVIGGLWQRAVGQARRAEASELFARGQLELETYPTAAIAYALAGLELADDPAGRQLALEALAKAPPATVWDSPVGALAFSPDGKWLAGSAHDHILLWSRKGGEPRPLGDESAFQPTYRFLREAIVVFLPAAFGIDSVGGVVRAWSLDDFRLLRALDLKGSWEIVGQTLYTVAPPGTAVRDLQADYEAEVGRENDHLVQAWPLDGGKPTTVARLAAAGHERVAVDPTASHLAFVRDGKLFATPLAAAGEGGERLVADPPGGIRYYQLLPGGKRAFLLSPAPEGASLWALDAEIPTLLRQFEAGEPVDLHAFDADHTLLATYSQATDRIRVWPLEGGEPRVFPAPKWVLSLAFSADARWLAAGSISEQTTHLYDLRAPRGAAATVLARGPVIQVNGVAFDPSGQWVATADSVGIGLWPIEPWRLPYVLQGHSGMVQSVKFSPDGRWVASAGLSEMRIWPLSGESPRTVAEGNFTGTAIHPSGRLILSGVDNPPGGTLLVSVDGTSRRELPGFEDQVQPVDFSPSGRLAAGGGGQFSREDESVVRIWDLEGGGSRVVNLEDGQWISDLTFLSERHLAVGSPLGVGIWDLESESFERLLEEQHDFWFIASNREGRILVGVGVGPEFGRSGDIRVWDLESETSTLVASHGNNLWRADPSPDGLWLASADMEGAVRVGPISGEEPHLLLGHEAHVMDLEFSPDGRWLASGARDMTVRLWPMPEGRPLHTLELEELLARLRSVTNLHVVKDETQPSGYRLVAEEFPGWEAVPKW